MARPRIIDPHLPQYLQCRRRPSGRKFYYYQRDGKKISLGADESRAVTAAVRLTEAWGTGEERFNDRIYEMLSEAEILSKAVPLEKICGVYFLIKNGAVDYIGKSLDVEDRLREHEATGRVFDSYHYIPCRPDDQRRLETAYIRLLDPPGNTFKPPNKVRFRNAGNGKRFLDLGGLDV